MIIKDCQQRNDWPK